MYVLYIYYYSLNFIFHILYVGYNVIECFDYFRNMRFTDIYDLSKAFSETELKSGKELKCPKNLLEKCMEWGLLPSEGEYLCPRCVSPLKLYVDSSW